MNGDKRESEKVEYIKSSKAIAVIATVIAIFFCAVLIISAAHITRPEYIPYQNGLVAVKKPGENIELSFNNSIENYQNYEIKSNEQGVYELSLYRTKCDGIVKKEGPLNNITLNQKGGEVKSLYYVSCGPVNDVLLYGQNIYCGGRRTLPNLFLVSCMKFAIVITIIFATLILIFKKAKKLRCLLQKIILVPITWLLSQLLITGYYPVSFTAIRDFYAILLLSIVMLLLFAFLYLKVSIKVRIK